MDKALKKAIEKIEYFEYIPFDSKEPTQKRPMAHSKLRSKYGGQNVDMALNFQLIDKHGNITYRAFMNPCDNWLDRISAYAWWADLQRIEDFYQDIKGDSVIYKYGAFVAKPKRGELLLGGGFVNPLHAQKVGMDLYRKVLSKTKKGLYFHNKPKINFL